MACGAEATIGGHQIGLEAAIMKILWLSFYGSKFLWHNQFFQFLAPQEVNGNISTVVRGLGCCFGLQGMPPSDGPFYRGVLGFNAANPKHLGYI
jgi:hypothetical protein